MKQFTYQTRGVCSRAIEITIDGDIVSSVRYVGGCSGNTQGVAALVRGMKITEAIERLEGIHCGMKNTSCPDQLAHALSAYMQSQN